MARKTKAEWAKVRAAYWKGEGSISQLAERFDIPLATITNRSRKQKWTLERARIEQEAAKEAAISIIEQRAARLARIGRLTSLVLDKAQATLEAVDTFDPEGLDDVSKSIARMIPLERESLGHEPTGPIPQEGAAGAEPTVLRVIRRGPAAALPSPVEAACLPSK